ncbi:MAG: short-chain fatty acid transporter [Geminicoccaceae bacterium]
MGLNDAARPFVRFVERYYPDPFIFAIALTFIVMLLALGLTPSGPVEVLDSWGSGLKNLLAFMAQIAITLITAHALAHTDAVRQLLTRLCSVPRTPFQAYFFTCFIGHCASLFSWGLGLIVGALVAQGVGTVARERGIKVHYPLLVASAYAGWLVWHMGYSGSAPLFVATPGHALEEQLGGTIPVTETTFATWNMLTVLAMVLVIPTTCALMHPTNSDSAIKEIPNSAAGEESVEQDGPPETPGQVLDQSKFFNIGVGLLLFLYLVYWFWSEGFDLTLDIVNWSFLTLGLLLARSAEHYVRLIADASQTVGQVLLQYPFYAGIMGVMIGTGLAEVIAQWFGTFSTKDTLPFWAFIAGGIINFFVPSGGGQWVVQGPIFIEAAKTLGTDPTKIVMGVAYGDQWTNMIQPFWTIPLLAIAGLHMRAIMGYCFVVFFAAGIVLGGSLLIIGGG